MGCQLRCLQGLLDQLMQGLSRCPMARGHRSPLPMGGGLKTRRTFLLYVPGVRSGGLMLIQDDAGEVDQGMDRIMEDNHIELLLQAGKILNEDELN
jgi:hypothetical protein